MKTKAEKKTAILEILDQICDLRLMHLKLEGQSLLIEAQILKAEAIMEQLIYHPVDERHDCPAVRNIKPTEATIISAPPIAQSASGKTVPEIIDEILPK